MDKTYYKSIDETVYHQLMDNGLNAYIIKKEGFQNKCAYFATKFGSFNTGDSIYVNNQEIKLIGGLAHFLEHRVFDYKEGNIIDIFYKLGADVNAYTSYDRTVYYFSTMNNFERCLELLLDFPTSFTMTREAVEKEKDIIVSELLMYKDDPNNNLFLELMKAMYQNHPIRGDVGGEPSEVKSTTYELLKEVHTTFYNPKNMYLVIVGDVDVDKTFALIENKQFVVNNNAYKSNLLKEDLRVAKDKIEVKGNVNNQKILLGYKLKPLDNLKIDTRARTFLSLDLLSSLLFARSSDFYHSLIINQDVSSLSVEILQYPEVFCLLIEADILKDEKTIIDKINERLNHALEIINEEELKRIKKKEIALLIKGSDSCASLAREFTSYLLDGMNYLEIIDIIKSIDINDLKNVYNEYLKDASYSYGILKGESDD